MIHPHTELRFINTEIGLGVFATQFIPKGTITWVRDDLDQVLTPEQFKGMPQIFAENLFKYTFRDAKGHHVLCWDAGRFVNHSCEPRCMGYSIDFEIAIRDIYPDEELTNDYMSLNPMPDESFQCQCGSQNCREWVSYRDLDRQTDQWVRLMQQAFTVIGDVPQPLRSLLKAGMLEQSAEYLNLRQNSVSKMVKT